MSPLLSSLGSFTCIKLVTLVGTFASLPRFVDSIVLMEIEGIIEEAAVGADRLPMPAKGGRATAGAVLRRAFISRSIGRILCDIPPDLAILGGNDDIEDRTGTGLSTSIPLSLLLLTLGSVTATGGFPCLRFSIFSICVVGKLFSWLLALVF